jgi:hypothetical protein
MAIPKPADGDRRNRPMDMVQTTTAASCSLRALLELGANPLGFVPNDDRPGRVRPEVHYRARARRSPTLRRQRATSRNIIMCVKSTISMIIYGGSLALAIPWPSASTSRPVSRSLPGGSELRGGIRSQRGCVPGRCVCADRSCEFEERQRDISCQGRCGNTSSQSVPHSWQHQ